MLKKEEKFFFNFSLHINITSSTLATFCIQRIHFWHFWAFDEITKGYSKDLKSLLTSLSLNSFFRLALRATYEFVNFKGDHNSQILSQRMVETWITWNNKIARVMQFPMRLKKWHIFCQEGTEPINNIMVCSLCSHLSMKDIKQESQLMHYDSRQSTPTV